MRELFREVKLNSYFSAIAGLIIGLVLLFWPGASLTLVCAVIGVAVLAVAVVQLVLFFKERMAGFTANYHLLLGILLLVVGGWFLVSPGSYRCDCSYHCRSLCSSSRSDRSGSCYQPSAGTLWKVVGGTHSGTDFHRTGTGADFQCSKSRNRFHSADRRLNYL